MRLERDFAAISGICMCENPYVIISVKARRPLNYDPMSLACIDPAIVELFFGL
jgi:hypothetical protein